MGMEDRRHFSTFAVVPERKAQDALEGMEGGEEADQTSAETMQRVELVNKLQGGGCRERRGKSGGFLSSPASGENTGTKTLSPES